MDVNLSALSLKERRNPSGQNMSIAAMIAATRSMSNSAFRNII